MSAGNLLRLSGLAGIVAGMSRHPRRDPHHARRPHEHGRDGPDAALGFLDSPEPAGDARGDSADAGARRRLCSPGRGRRWLRPARLPGRLPRYGHVRRGRLVECLQRPPSSRAPAPTLLAGFPPSPLGQALLYSAWLFAIGLVLFGLTVVQAGVLPRTGGWLLVIGGVLSRVMPMLDQRFHTTCPSIPG